MSTNNQNTNNLNVLSKTMSGQIQSFLSMVTTVGLTTLISVYFVFVYLPRHDDAREKQMEELRRGYDQLYKSLETVYSICSDLPKIPLRNKYPQPKKALSSEDKNDDVPVEIQDKKKQIQKSNLLYNTK